MPSDVVQTDIDTTAREAAVKQWTENPCGSQAGPDGANRVAFFKRVEIERYKQQPWQHDFFQFEQFAGKRVLEIGVGLGTDLLQFAEAGADCHAIDITEEHMKLARENMALHGYQADIRRSDATAIDFPDNYFDVVYSFGVVHHIPEIERVLAEIRRVLKPGGVALITVYYKWSANHLFALLFRQGVLKLKLLRLGYAGLVSTIELGADGKKIKPYVKLESRNGLASKLRGAGLQVREVAVRQLEPDHFGRVGLLLPPLVTKGLERRMGWYVAAVAEKPRDPASA